jgi:Coenzyme PQQ synthesis protein D (PqqD)
MTETTTQFRINEKLVTSKMIDGEAIIINLASGMYYSLDKTGAVAWLLIGGGCGLDEAADVLSARFSVPVGQVREDLVQLVNDLISHNLILPADRAAAPINLDPPTGDPYTQPVLNCYDDMGDVLALDPPLPQVEIENESWETSTK